MLTNDICKNIYIRTRVTSLYIRVAAQPAQLCIDCLLQ